jgi:phosphomannomutase
MLGCDFLVSNIDITDGLRMTLSNHDIIHLRPSGNAPELRCYAESDSVEKAKLLVQTVLKNIQSINIENL